MPCARNTLNAYKVCAHELMTLCTCSDTDKPLVIVTPSPLHCPWSVGAILTSYLSHPFIRFPFLFPSLLLNPKSRCRVWRMLLGSAGQWNSAVTAKQSLVQFGAKNVHFLSLARRDTAVACLRIVFLLGCGSWQKSFRRRIYSCIQLGWDWKDRKGREV